MNCEVICLCEAITVKNGQLCILHTFSNFLLPEAHCFIRVTVVTVTRFTQDEAGEHMLVFRVHNADGLMMFESAETHLTATFSSDAEQSLACHYYGELDFWAQPGSYEISLWVDGRQLQATILSCQSANNAKI